VRKVGGLGIDEVHTIRFNSQFRTVKPLSQYNW